MKCLRGLALALLLSSGLLPSLAQATLPISGEILIELENDNTYRAGDRESDINDLYFTIEPSFSFDLSGGFSIETGLVLEPVFDPRPDKKRWVDDHGLYVETLFLQYEHERFSLHAGKINPAFGLAWDRAPGIYGVDYAEDYELAERIGFGGSVQLCNGDHGNHQLTGDVFFLDTSFLSESTLNNRGHVRPSDGGVSNTGDLRSFSLTLQGEDMPALPGLTYHFGFEQQRGGQDTLDEHGYVAGLSYAFTPIEDVEVELLTEYVYLHNAEGMRQNRQYFTQSASAGWGGWNAALSYTKRDSKVRGDEDFGDYLFQASAGYAFPCGFGIDVGWRFAREEEVKLDGVGALLSYTFSF